MTFKSFLRTISLVALLICLFVGLNAVVDSRPPVHVNISDRATSDVYYADGRSAHFEDRNFGLLNKDDVAVLHLNLPATPLFDNSMLLFYDYNAVTEVWFGETMLATYGMDIDAKGLMIGNRYFQIPIPDEAWGNEITINVRAITDNAFSNFSNFRVYPSALAYMYYIDADPFGFICSIVLLTFGLLAIIGCLLVRASRAAFANAMGLVFTMLLVSLWLISNEGIYMVFGFDQYFWQPLEYMAGYTVVIPLLLFYRGMTHKNTGWNKVFGIAAATVTVFFIIATFLNYTSILHYHSLMGLAGVLILACAVPMLVYTLSLNSEGNRTQTMMKLGMYCLALTGIYEVFLRSVLDWLPISTIVSYHPLISIGLLIFAFFQVCAFVSSLHDRQNELTSMKVKADTLDKVIAETPAGICRLKLDDELSIVSANDLFYHIVGYSSEQLSKGRPQSIYSMFLDDGKTIIQEKIAAILQGQDTSGEFEIDTLSLLQLPITILVRYFYDKEDTGYITASIIDITDRKRAEEELRVREEDYRMAIEASDHFYFNYDPATKTCTHLFDSEKVFGISEKVGNIPESLIEIGLCAPDSIDDYREAFRKFAAGVPSGELCLHLRNIKTNELRWFGGSYRTIFDAQGKPLHAIAAFKDITEQREKEIAYNMHKQQIEAHPKDEITYYELNLTTGKVDYHYGTEAELVLANTSGQWDEMVAYAVDNVVHPEDKQIIKGFMQRSNLIDLLDHGVIQAMREYRGYKPNGELRWLRASVNIAADAQTSEKRAYCLIENIDEEKAQQLEREIELQRSRYYEEAYEKLSSSVMYGVCKYKADDELSIIFANDIFYQMHGYTSQKEALAAGFTGVLFATPPFGKSMVLAAHREYMGGKAGQLFETEYPSINAQGNRIWILCRGIYSPDERIFNSSVLNITDRKHAEEQLRISEERYKLALAQSGKVFFFFDVPTRTMHLSDDLAQAFGLPSKVDNMPDNFIAQGLVEPKSIDNYRHFYERIYAGEKSGDTIISCHMQNAPDVELWYKIAFTSVFDAKGVPQSAIITYEDLHEQRERELAGAWKQLNLLSIPESKYVVIDYNLTQNKMLSQTGGLFAKTPDFITAYDDVNAFVFDHFIHEDDVDNYRKFLDRSRMLDMFANGQAEDYIEYRSLQKSSTFCWTSTSVQMIRDPYSNDVLAQLLIMDIHQEKSGQIQMERNLEELKHELESSRIKVMINQMQPHFLYNALSAIQTIVKTDPDYAYRLIYDFTVHLRSSIKALSSDAPISFLDELKNIKAYLNIEQMRFGDSLKVKYEIDCDHFSVIPLSIQPLAENAARHGVYPKGDVGGTVTVRTYEADHAYVVEVEDDGTGFDVDEVLNRQSDSVGLKSLIFRLKSLMDADVAIVSKANLGTKVTVTIPKNED